MAANSRAKPSGPVLATGACIWWFTATTFMVFPLVGWLAQPLWALLLPPPLVQGMLVLCALPATVQSAIALTSIARGNIPAAVCSASASTLLGIVFTPLLVGALLAHSGNTGDPLQAVSRIAVQLLLPFALGDLLRPWTASCCKKQGKKSASLTKAPSCWWFMRPLAAPSSAACGSKCPLRPWRRCWACALCCWRSAWPGAFGSAAAWALTKPMRQPFCFAGRKKAWSAAFLWPTCCFQRRSWGP